jgi:hypothetical protein
MKFTPNEYELIEDRLGQSDCIADCLTDHHPDDVPVVWQSFETVDKRASELHESGFFESEFDMTALYPLDREILKDAIEGATMMADKFAVIDSVGRGKWESMVRAKNSLEKKTGWIMNLA